jgi:hypothetical protein
LDAAVLEAVTGSEEVAVEPEAPELPESAGAAVEDELASVVLPQVGLLISSAFPS